MQMAQVMGRRKKVGEGDGQGEERWYNENGFPGQRNRRVQSGLSKRGPGQPCSLTR